MRASIAAIKQSRRTIVAGANGDLTSFCVSGKRGKHDCRNHRDGAKQREKRASGLLWILGSHGKPLSRSQRLYGLPLEAVKLVPMAGGNMG